MKDSEHPISSSVGDDSNPPATGISPSAPDTQEASPPNAMSPPLLHPPTPPEAPSSVHGEVDEDDENWSRNEAGVSLPGDSQILDADDRLAHVDRSDDSQHRHQQQHILPTPQQPKLTLKEKLVSRERQRRIETERARLKQQFALSEGARESDTAGENSNDLFENDEVPDVHNRHNREDDMIRNDDSHGYEVALDEESTRAHVDEEESVGVDNRTLGFNMERFLSNNEKVSTELETTDENIVEVVNPGEQGVVMERFLNDFVLESSDDVVDLGRPVLHASPEDRGIAPNANNKHIESIIEGGTLEEDVPSTLLSEPHRTVSFDIEALKAGNVGGLIPATDRGGILDTFDASTAAAAGSQASFGEQDRILHSMVSHTSIQSDLFDHVDDYAPPTENTLTYSTSMEAQIDAASNHGDELSHASDEPRVLRLTEADMLEMASIDDASIGNAPPSDRDQDEMLSEIGELTDFPVRDRTIAGDTTISQDTPTTAVESASQISEHHSQRSAQVGVSMVSTSPVFNLDADRLSDHHSVTGIEGMPSALDPINFLLSPGAVSVVANPPSEGGRDVDDELPQQDIDGSSLHVHGSDPNGGVQLYYEERIDRVPELPFGSSNVSDMLQIGVPGIVNRPRHHNPQHNLSLDESIDSDSHGAVVEGFDFDKNAPRSPFLEVSNSLQFDSIGAMDADPITTSERIDDPTLANGPRRLAAAGPVTSVAIQTGQSNYGATNSAFLNRLGGTVPDLPNLRLFAKNEEGAPLLASAGQTNTEINHQRRQNQSQPTVSMKYMDRAIFSLRSEGECETSQHEKETDSYCASSILAKAFPDRVVSMLMIVSLEIPLMLMIVGGSDVVCEKIGRKRHLLLLGFLPITCACLGNVGVQARTLTKRAIARSRVTSISFNDWLLQEIGAAAIISIVSGAAIGALALSASGYDAVFGISIFAAQCFGMMAAVMASTVSPLLHCFVFKSDSGNWTASVENAVHDVIGGISILMISCRIICWFGYDIDPSDRCAV